MLFYSAKPIGIGRVWSGSKDRFFGHSVFPDMVAIIDAQHEVGTISWPILGVSGPGPAYLG
ncbi:hypothetical protein D3874_04905 [Oleomonas cavernae]|uniref:Uncharacterized protein n=1 Tax=Oleomonas cavernae TaxID=2320859 RepID=A0A418W8W0_9PROT|nr:hypothetical protein D3874_04905 [Oleomonas cavernae]